MSKFAPRPFGKYFLLEKLAMGGMAEIYKAKTFGVDGFEKQLAIKKILPHCSADKDFITMLIDEAKLSVLLSHTNIVQVYDLGKVGDDYFISMEFIDGSNLRQLLQRAAESETKLPVEICVYIMSEICKGLDYAHRKKDHHNQPLHIVHRDISPQNILISYDGEVKIVDFGIAKAAMNMSQTTTGILKGKVSYMSPEQALGKPLDNRTDIFSSALVFYEMLVGKKLFSGETQFEVLKKIHSTHLTETDLDTTIPAPLRLILGKALAYEPEERYENAGDLQIELTKYLYATYSGFSPRQLSQLMQKWFEDELTARKERAIRDLKAIDAKTQTALMRQEEENIVHRSEADLLNPQPTLQIESRTATEIEAPRSLSQRLPVSETQESSFSSKTRRQRVMPVLPKATKHRTVLAAIVVLFVSIFSGLGIYLYTTSDSDTPKPPLTLPKGTIAITSTPAAAEIYLNNTATSQITPATLTQLDLYTPYTIELRKAAHELWQQSVTLSSADPLTLSATLSPISPIPPTPPIPIVEETPKIESSPESTIVSPETAPSEPVTAPIESPPPQAPVTATVIIESVPSGAKVHIGKSLKGTTPLRLELAPQSYTVSVSKSGFETQKTTVTLKAGETKTLASVALKKIEPMAEPTPKRIPPPPVRESELPTETGQTGEPASVSVSSIPDGATVYLNGVAVGKTPGTFPTQSGKVTLLIDANGLMPYRTTFTLKPKEKKKLGTITLQATTGKIRIASKPSGADVFFNGEMAGSTPLLVRGVLKGEPYRIDVRYTGFKNWSKTITLDQNSLEIMADLEK